MDNDKKVYVIRDLGFCYDDQYYFPLQNSDSGGGMICGFSQDKETAINIWKRLEYDFSHKENFNNVCTYDEFGYELDQIGFDTADFFNRREYMDQDELFNIIYKLKRNVFFLYEYPADLKAKVLWDIHKHSYIICDELAQWGDMAIEPKKTLITYLDSKGIITFKGTLEELTDAPLLLNQLIEQDPNLNYDSQKHLLEIKPDEQTLNSVNALLKNPLYEIHYLTIQEIYEIEQTLNKKL